MSYPSFGFATLESLKINRFAKIGVLNDFDLYDAKNLIASWVSTSSGMQLSFHDIATGAIPSGVFDLLRSKKDRRILDEDHCGKFLRIEGIRSLIARFPGFELADVTYGNLLVEKRPEIYLRIVRPLCREDVGNFHQDRWYTSLYTPHKADVLSFKVWLAIEVPPQSGLQFAPLSSPDTAFEVQKTIEGPRPVNLSPPLDCDVVQPFIQNGEAFIFDQYAMHRGAVNKGPLNRISVELCFFKK
jgi:hypothetical protein